MALVPSRQLYLDSFQSSFSKFNGTQPLHFFRYNSSSIPLKPHIIYSNSQTNKNPPRKSSFIVMDKANSFSLSTSDNWLSKWNKPNKENQPKPPHAAFNYRSNKNNYIGSGGGGGRTMERIVEKLRKHGYIEGDGNEKRERAQERVIEKGSVEDIFYVEEGMLPNSRGGFSKESPLGVESVFESDGQVRFPWEKPKKENDEEEEGKWTARRKSRTALAELTLPESELRRLRNLTHQTRSKMRVKSAGVTQELVDAIHEKWKKSEIVRVKVEGKPALNMRRMHEILEKKTGGLVIWRSGSSMSLYRGVSYEVPSVQLNKRMSNRNEISNKSLPATTGKTIKGPSNHDMYVPQIHAPQSNLETNAEVKENEPQSNLETNAAAKETKEAEIPMEVKYEDEIDKLLDGLGSRYMEWPECDPLPVDADMLPGIIPGYQPPFRILPYGLRSTLGTREITSLRRLARVLPPHFALGRSRHLQGLAVAMIKLWEKSSIAKIALKRGVQLTTSERMAEDIKKLTGGILLSRSKDFLVFYRGKTFLSPDVAEALVERETLAKSLQDEEEQARLRASAFVVPSVEKLEIMEQSGTAGTLEETLDADARWGTKLNDSHKKKIMREAEIERHANLVRKLERKLAFSERKLRRAERALSKVEAFLKPAERQADPESITDEERFMFRKLGLRMHAFLLLGRRGVFDGTVENMHLHWKYRELVKIVLKAPTFEQVKRIALTLEAESGGVLVSVDKVSKGYAIIVYRGKDYQRPSTLRPRNLLSKRKALARSIEMQRHEALLKHISALQIKVEKIRSEIEKMDIVKNQGDKQLYDRLDSAYPTDDDNDNDDDNHVEVEGDEAYLETYYSEDDTKHGDDKTGNAVHNVQLETNFPYSVQNHESKTKPEEDEDEANLETNNSKNGDNVESDDLVQNLHSNFLYNFQNEKEYEVRE